MKALFSNSSTSNFLEVILNSFLHLFFSINSSCTYDLSCKIVDTKNKEDLTLSHQVSQDPLIWSFLCCQHVSPFTNHHFADHSNHQILLGF